MREQVIKPHVQVHCFLPDFYGFHNAYLFKRFPHPRETDPSCKAGGRSLQGALGSKTIADVLRPLRRETDFSFRFFLAPYESTDRLEDNLKLFVVPALKRGKLPRELRVIGEQFPHSYEGPHDFHVDEHGPIAAQETGKHGRALLGEGVGLRTASAPT